MSGFGRDVLEALMRIPRGRVVTYGTLARGVGRPGAARAAGAACRSNPVGLLIPCHRVVASGGPGGYSGSDPAGIPLKLSLLGIEGASPGPGGRFGPPFLLGELPAG
ncbi:MAG TPA: methylated-DNA--[protein]-cysteine S-methyltransferase [Candidatus Fermentibacter daniensis]|nr:methylated-DNA--[protein]-cysteine S-methyltransferase [Candidatus Fermentibacter daniensis]